MYCIRIVCCMLIICLIFDLNILENADIICLTEMKASLSQNPIKFDDSYQIIWNQCTEKKGYSGIKALVC